ncbi:hypothetical protein ABID43_000929 [Methylobacterium goesingense]|uniref:BLUF domain-containing protein n=2 Tax=Methylobacterium goesingense TaxID=243690 RepID=A0ABV2L0Q9_9HYPH
MLGKNRRVRADAAAFAGYIRCQVGCLRRVIVDLPIVGEPQLWIATMRAKRTTLVHLIYFSRLNLSADATSRTQQIGEITRQAQKKNEFAVITSFLIIEQNFAAQIIEGERTSVSDTFARISNDSRHRDVQIVEWREIVKREFVNSFTTGIRTPVNDGIFQKASLLPMFQRGTPKAGAIHALAVTLQAESMTKQGIDHLFV